MINYFNWAALYALILGTAILLHTYIILDMAQVQGKKVIGAVLFLCVLAIIFMAVGVSPSMQE